MNQEIKDTNAGRDSNPDLITGAPGSHPIATGVGAAGAGAAGAVVGTMVAGPVGTVVGAVIGAVAGGLGGKAVGEVIDPTGEDNYWRENHATQPYAEESVADFDAYSSAYRTGYEGHHSTGQSFDDAEPELRTTYQSTASNLPWENARDATRAAWTRVENGEAVRRSSPE